MPSTITLELISILFMLTTVFILFTATQLRRYTDLKVEGMYLRIAREIGEGLRQ